jgi:NitT/TauT family transport system permease protein
MLVGFVLYYVIDLVERLLIPWKVSSAVHQLQV